VTEFKEEDDIIDALHRLKEIDMTEYQLLLTHLKKNVSALVVLIYLNKRYK
jgi:hypothetical protein